MHDTLISFIQGHATTPLTEQEIAVVKELFVPRKYRKGQFFLQEGEICKNYGFIVNGAMRQYAVDEKGTENILGLQIENWWCGDRDSYFKEQPSIYNIDAWENSELLLISKENIDRMVAIPAFIEMRIKLDDNHSIANQKRLLCHIGASAEKRYENFLQHYPQFLERFPLRMIASFLGITKETLSRIRRHAGNS
ncbi:Crp/Fnr family transcriptional regulator [Flavobacterium sp.]|uniref:Crp/Fnr family transcriptional regulator n=1 Tax=Flavobacterium sp. TaxID=239 RepID=UPI001227D59B|nr:Crp/Fnr family transcriptional regulator [Flavobacterium sp.]RZJ73041.1 MAG: Crp/Fnr family transcriptional regulator [Flavobacterium sp.]